MEAGLRQISKVGFGSINRNNQSPGSVWHLDSICNRPSKGVSAVLLASPAQAVIDFHARRPALKTRSSSGSRGLWAQKLRVWHARS